MPRLGLALRRLLFRASKLKRIEWYDCYTTLDGDSRPPLIRYLCVAEILTPRGAIHQQPSARPARSSSWERRSAAHSGFTSRRRHEIFAGNKQVPLTAKEHSLVLRDGIVTQEVQHDLDRLGIAKTAREEKTRARDAKIKQTAEDARMAKLYREQVLKEAPGPELVQIGGIAAAPKPEEREEVGSFGD